MDNSSGTPSWFATLIAIFALGAAAVFGLYLYRHTERAALESQNYRLAASLKPLRIEEAAVKDRIKPLDDQIALRRAKVESLKENEGTNKGDVDRLVAANAATLKTNQDLQRKELTGYGDLMREAPERRKEVAREEERAFTSERDNDERRRQMREDVEKQSQSYEQIRKKWLGENGQQDNRIGELEGRVRQLTQQLDVSNREFRPDGQVLASAAKDGFIVIDRGQVHHLRRDTKFTVYNRRAGKLVVKGQAVVVSVEDRIATCRVSHEADANDPIIAGDLLHNPVYDAEQIRGFAIRGEFQRFSRTEIMRFIADSGGRLDQSLTTETDFLVAGVHAQQDLEQAVKLGISIISEDQLIEFLRGVERPSPITWDYLLAAGRAGKSFALAGRFTAADEDLVRESIKKAGGRTGSLSSDSAGLIAGEDALDDMARARELGVPVIGQRQFSALVDPDRLGGK